MKKITLKNTLRLIPVTFTFFLFLFTVSFLNYKGYISTKDNLLNKKEVIEDIKTILTDLKIKDIDIKGKIIYEEDNQLKIFDPSISQKDILIEDKIVDSPGMLADGRIYFWEKPNSSYEWLYIQKGQLFEKHKIELKKNDGGESPLTPPLVSPNGEFIIFTSDRDSNDNYFRRNIYKYDLLTYKLDRLTRNNYMTVYSLEISPDSRFIAFSYQNLEPSKPSNPIALGLIFADTKTPNLFPKIQINNSLLIFSSDSQYLFLTSQKGPLAFEISKAQTLDSIEGGEIITINKDNLLVITHPFTEENKDLMLSCKNAEAKDEKLLNYKLDLYKFENNKFEKIVESHAKNALISFAKNPYFQLSSINNEILTLMQNNDFCQKTLGIFNLNNQTVNPTYLSPEKNYLWIE